MYRISLTSAPGQNFQASQTVNGSDDITTGNLWSQVNSMIKWTPQVLTFLLNWAWVPNLILLTLHPTPTPNRFSSLIPEQSNVATAASELTGNFIKDVLFGKWEHFFLWSSVFLSVTAGTDNPYWLLNTQKNSKDPFFPVTANATYWLFSAPHNSTFSPFDCREEKENVSHVTKQDIDRLTETTIQRICLATKADVCECGCGCECVWVCVQVQEGMCERERKSACVL